MGQPEATPTCVEPTRGILSQAERQSLGQREMAGRKKERHRGRASWGDATLTAQYLHPLPWGGVRAGGCSRTALAHKLPSCKIGRRTCSSEWTQGTGEGPRVPTSSSPSTEKPEDGKMEHGPWFFSSEGSLGGRILEGFLEPSAEQISC